MQNGDRINEKVPGGHIVHDTAFAAENVPAGHEVHSAVSIVEYVPAGQALQMPETQKYPGPQVGHAVRSSALSTR